MSLVVGTPANSPENEFIIVDGTARFVHAVLEVAGLQDKFGSGADHTHFEHQNFNSNPKQSAVIYMFRGNGDPNSVSLAGKSAFWSTTAYSATEDSIDTTGTAQTPSSPDYKATVMLRYTNSVSLSVDTEILLAITGPVAGIQAAVYSGKVTQAPTLVSGKYEVLVEVNGFDSLHWNYANRANDNVLRDNWQLNTITVSAVQSNKSGIDGNYESRADQILCKFGAAHGLAVGDCVVLNVKGSLSGLTGLSSNTQYSGYVSKIVSSTQAAVVLGIIQLTSTHPSTSGTTSNTSNWDLYPGVVDPAHMLMLPAQCWTFWRNSAGVTTRIQIGGLTGVESNYSTAVGYNNFIKSGSNNSGAFGNDNVLKTTGYNYAFGDANTVEEGGYAYGSGNTLNAAGCLVYGAGNDTNSKIFSFLFGRSLTAADEVEVVVGNTDSSKITFTDAIMKLVDAMPVQFGTTTGNQLGTSTSQKIAFHGSTPVAQRAGSAQAAVSTTAATNSSPYGYTTAAQADAIVTLVNEIRATLVEKGLMKGSA